MPLSHGRARRWASASLDEALTPARQRALDEHLDSCAACSEWYDAAGSIGRRVRMRQPRLEGDLTPEVLATSARIQSAVRASVLFTRWSLVAIALVQVYLTLPDLVSHQHEEHHLAVFDLALALSMLFAAWRPAKAVGMLPFLAVLGVGLAATSTMDIANGETPALSEIPHLLVLLEAGLIWHLQRFGVPRISNPSSPSAAIPQDQADSRKHVA